MAPVTLFDLHADILASVPFFCSSLHKNFRASDPIFDVCTQTFRLQIFEKFCTQKNFDQARQREQHKHHDKESLSLIFWVSMLFDCFRELVCSLLALSIAHVNKHAMKKPRGHAGNQKHTWVGYPSVSTFGQAYGTSFCQVDMDSRSRPRRAGTPKPLANVLCPFAEKCGNSARHV